MQGHSKSATFLATKLAEAGVPLIYPGLKTNRDFELMQQLVNPGFGAGGMLVVDCKTLQRAQTLATRLQEAKFGLYAVSLGFSRTLMSCPSVTTSSEIPENLQTDMGLSKGLLRLSIGFLGNDETMTERFLQCYRSLES